MGQIHTTRVNHEPSAFCFSDIIESTDLWEADSSAMWTALQRHNEIFRELLPTFGGYEVKHTGDGFFLCFPDAVQSLRFCLATLKAMRNEPWEKFILDFRRLQDDRKNYVRRHSFSIEQITIEEGQVTRQSATMQHTEVRNSPIFGRRSSVVMGLAFRMGLNYGVPHAVEEDFQSGKLDYFGPAVNRASRVENEAVADEVTISDAVLVAIYESLHGEALPVEELNDSLRVQILRTQAPRDDFSIICKGQRRLKGIGKPAYVTAVRLRR